MSHDKLPVNADREKGRRAVGMSGYDNAIGGKLKLKGKALSVDPTLKKKKKKKSKPPPGEGDKALATQGERN
jgi:hypothetical protein